MGTTFITARWDNAVHREEDHCRYICGKCNIPIAITKRDPYIMEQVRKKGEVICTKCAMINMDDVVAKNQARERLQLKLLRMQKRRGK